MNITMDNSSNSSRKEEGTVAIAEKQQHQPELKDSSNNNDKNDHTDTCTENDNKTNTSKTKSNKLGELWDTLQSEFTNMGRALTCPLCLSTYKDAVVLPCVHAYCGSCLTEALRQGPPRCPTCLTKATRRSMAPAPVLNELTKTYKLALRHFGLAPVQYDPSYNAMTQIDPGEADSQGNNGLTMEPLMQSSAAARSRRKSHNLVESHTQLLVSRTWQKVLQEQQEEADRVQMEIMKATAARSSSTRASSSSNDNQSKQKAAAASSRANLPANIPTSGRLHQWYQQQQASVIASHERALIDAAKQKQKKTPTSTPINLSMQHDLGMEQALEQQVADRQAEDEAGEYDEPVVQEAHEPPAESNTGMTTATAATDIENKDSEEPLPPKEAVNAAATQESSAFFTPREAESQPVANTIPVNSNPNSLDDATHPLSLLEKQPAEDQDSIQPTAQPIVAANPTIVFEFPTASSTTVEKATDETTKPAVSTKMSDDANNSDDETVGDEAIDSDDETVGEDMETDDAEIPIRDRATTAVAVAINADVTTIQTDTKSNEDIMETDDVEIAPEDSAETVIATTVDVAVVQNLTAMSIATSHTNDNDDQQCSSGVTPTPRQSNTASQANNSDNAGSGNHQNSETSDVSPTPRLSNIATQANNSDNASNESLDSATTAAVESEASDNANASTVFQVGDIVQVQSRTWPGVNKPGGIARISKVLSDSGSYHVSYVLGGREKNVDGLFIALPPEEMTQEDTPANNTAAAATAASANKSQGSDKRDTSFSSTASNLRERKSRRIITQHKQEEQQLEEIKVKMELDMPADLMKLLAAEGFDVTPRAACTPTASSFRNPVTSRGRAGRRVRIKVDGEAVGPSRAKSLSRTATTSLASADGRRTQSEGNGRPGKKPPTKKDPVLQSTTTAKKDPVLQSTPTAKQEKKDAKKRNAPMGGDSSSKKNKKSTFNKTAPKKRRKIQTMPSTPTINTAISPLPESIQEICAMANSHYQQRVQAAWDSKIVCIVSSGLSDDDKASLKSLCKQSKKNGQVQLKQTDVFNAQKTTFCLIPGATSSADAGNLVGQCRTLKAMRTALAGIPLVSSAWLQACRDLKSAVVPSDSMWIRSLPVRSQVSEAVAISQYGVAKVAAQATHRANQSLRNCTVQLCGTFARPPKADVQILLREAGATVSLQTSSTVAALRNLNDATGAKQLLVLICDDACTTIADALQRQVKAAVDDSKSNKTKQVLVVSPQWLFDSVVTGSPLPADGYPPTKKQPLALWKMIHPQTEKD